MYDSTTIFALNAYLADIDTDYGDCSGKLLESGGVGELVWRVDRHGKP